MCVYSTKAKLVRKATRGQKLVTYYFGHIDGGRIEDIVMGFATEADNEEPTAAVCLYVGSVVRFSERPKYMTRTGAGLQTARARHSDATVILSNGPHGIEDALEFPDGFVLPMRLLELGQSAKVLDLSAAEVPKRDDASDSKRVNA